MKFESHWHKGLGGDRFKANYIRFFSVFSCGGQFLLRSGTVLAIFGTGSSKQHSYEV